MSFKQWWAEKKYQMTVGMEMQLAKYPDNDPRKEPLRKKIDRMREEVDDGSDGE